MRHLRAHTRAGLLTGAALTGLALTVAALSGCGAKADQPAVATAVTGSPTATPSATGAGDEVVKYVNGMRAWVGCMRTHGVDLPDPDARGKVDMGDNRKNKSNPAFLRAQENCRSAQPGVPPAQLQDTLPPLTAEQIANARAYAACMRANGDAGFRDPGPDGYPVQVNGTPPTDTAAPEAQLKAGQICDPVLNGKPPTTYDPSVKGNG